MSYFTLISVLTLLRFIFWICCLKGVCVLITTSQKISLSFNISVLMSRSRVRDGGSWVQSLYRHTSDTHPSVVHVVDDRSSRNILSFPTGEGKTCRWDYWRPHLTTRLLRGLLEPGRERVVRNSHFDNLTSSFRS